MDTEEDDIDECSVAISKQFKFSLLCEYLQCIKNVPKQAKTSRRRIFTSLLEKWSSYNRCQSQTTESTSNCTASFYPALRLIINAYDNRKFNMKSKKLIAKVCKVLLIPDETKKELLKIDSTSSKLAIARLAKEISDRNPSSRDASVFDVNESLDKIMDAELRMFLHAQCKMIRISGESELSTLLKECPSARELFWLMNILIRNVERCIGIAASTLINWVHENGNELRQSGTTLEKICRLATKGELHDDSSILFRMFEPMLLSRIKHGSNVYDKLVQYCGKPFYVELKFDGEHFLLHCKRTTASDSSPSSSKSPDVSSFDYRYYSRNQNDFTATISSSLNQRIGSFFASSLKNCILDAELLLWDTVDKKYVGKGRVASDGRVYDVKNLKDSVTVQACLAVFDVLFLNGESLMNTTLEKRKQLLRDGSVFCGEDRAVIFNADFHVVNSRDQFVELYQNAMRDGEEGIVVKKIDSFYKIGVRYMVNGWFKVKPFHLGEETLDLAIVGVDLGRNGYIENFVVAVLRDDKFYIVGKVARGLDDVTRKRLIGKLKLEHGWLSGKMVPDWIHRKCTNSDRATNYVHRDNLQVVEVKASGIINGKLQFPSLRFYRDDKPVKDIDKYEDFLDFEKNLRSQSLAKVESQATTGQAETRKRAAMPQVASDYRTESKKSCVGHVNYDLKGKQICVIQGNAEVTMQKLREIIESFGATFLANPRAGIAFVLSGQVDSLKTKSIRRSGKYNVVSSDWALRCQKAKAVLPIKESEAVNIVEASLLPCNGEIVDDDVIEREEVTVDKLRDMLDKIDTTKESVSDSAGATNALREELLKDEKFHRFANMIFYLHESVPSIMTQYVRTVLRMHGGEISDAMGDCVTHLVVEDCDNVGEELSAAHSTRKFVNIKWIEEAVEL